jgi:hypothetical protein
MAHAHRGRWVVRALCTNLGETSMEPVACTTLGASHVGTSTAGAGSCKQSYASWTARHYGETVLIDERTCMRRGDATCTFEVRFNAGVNLTKHSSVTPAGRSRFRPTERGGHLGGIPREPSQSTT